MRRVFLQGMIVVAAFSLARAATGQTPKSATRPPWEPTALEASIIARVSRDGQVSINHQPIAWEQLGHVLKSVFDPRPEKTLHAVEPHGSRRQELRRIMATATIHGVRVVTLARDPYVKPQQKAERRGK